MKILNQQISWMYVVTIILLSAFATVSSYELGQAPYALIIAVISTSAFEIALTKLYLKQNIKIPFSGLITGLIIGSVAPINSPLMLPVLAAAVAILSKFFVKIKSANIFNPAALGLLVALVVFGMGDQWWAASSYNLSGVIVSFTPLLIIAAYEARRTLSGLSFIVITLAISLILSRSVGVPSVSHIIALLASINYLFAFVMVADPKTSPHKNILQIIFGGFVALIVALLSIYAVPYSLLIALLAGNLCYALYRTRS